MCMFFFSFSIMCWAVGFFYIKVDWIVILHYSYPQGGLKVDRSLFSLTVTEKEIVICMSVCRASLLSKENNRFCFL